MINLYELDIDDCGIVKYTDLDSRVNLRLSEMGLLPGSLIRMVNKSAFGGPIYIKINNYYLCIRKKDALKITIDINE